MFKRVHEWFLRVYGDAIARRRHAVEEEARSLGATRIVWKDDNGCEVIWSARNG
jgi:hypothetical protein